MPSGPNIEASRSGSRRLALVWIRAPRFVRNAAISLPTFLLDLGLLYLLVHRDHVDYLAATLAAFFVANGLGYFLARWFVFHGTRRGVRAGFLYFLAIAALSAVAVTVLMWLFVGLLRAPVIPSRIAAAILTGVGGYLMNLVLNFRMARGQLGRRREL